MHVFLVFPGHKNGISLVAVKAAFLIPVAKINKNDPGSCLTTWLYGGLLLTAMDVKKLPVNVTMLQCNIPGGNQMMWLTNNITH
ncbi:hypothetical protein [Chitinophaga sp.]|uniref:hypothetical protein n=1 Tax=Chitinophaga sp. TaxID=1869181 RepID=UPI00260D7C7F|nr:hypothetical protein [uncultured Chitinophaga sp.]